MKFSAEYSNNQIQQYLNDYDYILVNNYNWYKYKYNRLDRDTNIHSMSKYLFSRFTFCVFPMFRTDFTHYFKRNFTVI